MQLSHIPRKPRKRLIPLTESLQEFIMNSDGDCDTSDIKSISVTTLIRNKINDELLDMSICDKFVRKDEIEKYIKRIVEERLRSTRKDDTKTRTEESVVNEWEDKNLDKMKQTNATIGKATSIGEAKTKSMETPKFESQLNKPWKENTLNVYDETYYERRQFLLNLLYYKKSETTIELNRRILFDPSVHGTKAILPKDHPTAKTWSTFLVQK
ncbi:uncharacterized protein LOC142224171 [Haematobia irritans]|uniref:uncharacterized protein LOC142224171 n=1 Tax=Haematobia irritans TaxID=7368 RepID=UPI003F506EFF